MFSDILSENLQIWGIEQDFVIFIDGSLGFGIELQPIAATCYLNETINLLTERLTHFISNLPVGTKLQFSQDIGAGVEKQIQDFELITSKNTSVGIKNFIEARALNLRQMATDCSLYSHTLRMFVRIPLSGPLLQPGGMFQSTTNYPDVSEDRLGEEVKKAQRTRQSIMSSLKSSGFSLHVLTGGEILSLVYLQWNPGRGIPMKDYDLDNVKDSMFFTDVQLTPNGFVLGRWKYRVVTLKIKPQETTASMGEIFSRLPYNSRLFFSIRVPDQGHERSILERQRKTTFSLTSASRGDMSDLDGEAKLSDINNLTAAMVRGERVVHCSIVVLVWAEDEEELEEKVSETLLLFQDYGGAEALCETMDAFDIFAGVALPNTISTKRSRRYTASNIAEMLPIYGPWRGHKVPVCTFISRDGTLVNYDPFDENLDNPNLLVFGGSGSGKSFMVNTMLCQLQRLKNFSKGYIFDIGGSYRHLVEQHGGEYLTVGELDTPFTYNIFDLPSGETAPSNQKIKHILGLISIICSDVEQSLSLYQRAEIEGAILETFKSENSMLRNLKDHLLCHSDEKIRDVGSILKMWCEDSPYGKFLDRPTNINLKNQLVCFDFHRLHENPDLQAAMIYLISTHVWDEIEKDRTKITFTVFDECFDFFVHEPFAKLVTGIFRRGRKIRNSGICISQDISDFELPYVKGALLSNSATKGITRQQKGTNFEDIARVLSLNSREVEVLKSLEKVNGEYAEVLLVLPEITVPVAVTASPMEYWTATSRPADIALKIRESEKFPDLSLEELTKQLAKKYPNGALEE